MTWTIRRRTTAHLLARLVILAALQPLPVTADPYAYVKHRSENLVSVVDLASDTVTTTIAIPGSGPGDGSAVVHPSGNTAYVLDQASKSIIVIDAQSHTISATIPLDETASFAEGPAIAIHPTGSELYIPHEIADPPGTIIGSGITVIDTESNMVTDVIDLGETFETPYGIAVDPAGNTLYVTDFLSAQLVAVDLSASTITGPVFVGGLAYDVAVHPDGSTVYVASDDHLVALDPATLATVNNIPVGGSDEHYGMSLSPDGATAYMSDIDGSLFVIDTGSANLTDTLFLGGQPYGVASAPDGAKIYITDTAEDRLSVVDAGTLHISTIAGPGPSRTHGRFAGPAPTFVGGSVEGATLARARCRNRATDQDVGFRVSGDSAWDCERAGLIARSGDRIEMRIRGQVVEDTLSGRVSGIAPVAISCLNRSTETSAPAARAGNSWHCEPSRIQFLPGDSIGVSITGRAH